MPRASYVVAINATVGEACFGVRASILCRENPIVQPIQADRYPIDYNSLCLAYWNLV
jgi:hypothetical protein